MLKHLSQIWPPAPRFTGNDVDDLEGKVYIVTGATSGVGKELAKLLYSKNATVYLGSRSEARAAVVITEIGVLTIQTRGCLNPLEINLEDLDSVARAAKHFLQRENNLDGLFNNAGIMLPPLAPLDAKTKQGYDLQFGTNTIASFRFTRLLTPIMAKTAKGQDPGGVRVVWVASSAAELLAPKGGIDMNNLDLKKPVTSAVRYAESKAGMALLSQEYARRHKSDGIISVALNPGNLKTDLRRHLSWPAAIVFGWISHEPIKGAYTELFAGFSKEIKLGNSGCWVIPWGRISPVRQDIRDGSNPSSEGGSGLGAEFWDWCEAEVQPYKHT